MRPRGADDSIQPIAVTEARAPSPFLLSLSHARARTRNKRTQASARKARARKMKARKSTAETSPSIHRHLAHAPPRTLLSCLALEAPNISNFELRQLCVQARALRLRR
eukprot:4910612-Pleurochrysis_carterae.AAC.1